MSRRQWKYVIAESLGLMCLVIVSTMLCSEPSDKGGNMGMSAADEILQGALPEMDRMLPRRYETATFGLG